MNEGASGGRVVIAGGSGFLGISLATHLSAIGFEIVLLSRHAPKASGPWRHVKWDARTLGDWRRELDGAAGLVISSRGMDSVTRRPSPLRPRRHLHAGRSSYNRE